MADLTVSHAALRNPETNIGVQDCCDWRVFAVPHAYRDRNNGPIYGRDDFDAHQPHDGPTYIVVGDLVADERLQRHMPMLGERYGVTLEQLQAARAGCMQFVRIEKPTRYQ